jgi:hypothetical protein
MMNKSMRHWRAGLGVLLCGALSVRGVAEGLEDFKLVQAVPAGATLVAAARQHEGQAFVKRQVDRFMEAVQAQHLERDVKRLAKQLWTEGQSSAASVEGGAQASATAAEDFERRWQQVSDLAGGVNWLRLGERESAFAMTLGFPTAEMVLLVRPPAESVGRDYAGLAAILKAVAELDPGSLVLASEGEGETSVVRLTWNVMPLGGLTLARHADAILFGFGSGFVEQSLGLLRGGAGERLAGSARFGEAFRGLSAPADGFMFFDAARLMSQTRGVADTVLGMIEPQVAQDAAQAASVSRVKAALHKLIDGFDLWDYAAQVSATKEMKTTTEGVLVLRDDAKSRLMYPALYGPGPVEDPLKFVPKDAGDVSVDSGVDLGALYGTLLNLVRESIPEAVPHLDEFATLQQAYGVDIGKDVLGWIHGHSVSFSVPGPSPFSPADWAWLLRVQDESKAREMIGRAFDTFGPLLEDSDVVIKDAAIEGTQGFRSVTHPLMGMVGLKALTVGVHEGWLFIGSDVKVVSRALEVGSGKGENFSANERFQKEGLAPGKRVGQLSFRDETKTGEQLGQALEMLPGLQLLPVPGLAEMFRNPRVQFAVDVLAKLGRAFKKLDFLLSSASVTTFDGKRHTSKAVMNYREPRSSAAPVAEPSSPKDPAKEAGANKP